MNMKNLTLLLLTIVSMTFVACGGEQPVSVGEEKVTMEARRTEIPVTQTAEAQGRYDRLAKIAPSGTVIETGIPGNQHDDSVTYPFGELPPNGGVHHNSWQKCQVYDQPIYSHHAIHSLEHGAVWVTYQPDLDEDMVSDLEGLTRGEPFVMVSPHPEQRSPIILTAWGLQLELDSSDDDRIDAFIQAFANGINNQEPGATCTAGVETVAEG